jgi:hypothetical protein
MSRGFTVFIPVTGPVIYGRSINVERIVTMATDEFMLPVPIGVQDLVVDQIRHDLTLVR